MATFLPNVTDVFAGVSDFDPDFNRIERMLKIRENAYQQGAKKVKGLYDSVFNSQMLRDQNIKTRDAYLKTISDTLNSLSSTDLSLPQNQRMATELFNPVLTDNNITKDIAYTRSYFDEMGKAEKLRTSSDGETRKRYWNVGIKAMQYQAEDFKNADAATALGMSAPKYSQHIDVQDLATKLYDKAKISVKQDTINGGYIFTKKNGDLVFPISKSFVETMFSQDPAITDMLRTQAYVERKDFISQKAGEFGGKEAAEKFYLQSIITAGGKVFAEDITQNETEVKKLQDRIESWNKKITRDGIEPGSEEHKKYLQDLENLKMAKDGLAIRKNATIPPKNIDFNNIEDLRQQADNLVTFSNYTMLANKIAQQLAYKNAEFTVKADPISLAHLRADLSLRNNQVMENIRYRNRLDVLEKEIQAGKYKKAIKGTTKEEKKAAIDSLVNRNRSIIPKNTSNSNLPADTTATVKDKEDTPAPYDQ